MFALGATTLYLDGKIHDLQKQLLILEGNMKEEEDVNAAINVDMLKFASFDKIKSTAENDECYTCYAGKGDGSGCTGTIQGCNRNLSATNTVKSRTCT